MDSIRRLPIVVVIGSGDPDHCNPELAAAVGCLIAEMGFHLLTGGGRGVMADACRGFTSEPQRAGLAIGIIPRSAAGNEAKAGYPNPWVELPILTHLPGRLGPDGADSRIPINILTATPQRARSAHALERFPGTTFPEPRSPRTAGKLPGGNRAERSPDRNFLDTRGRL